jgi:hypothetical protein
MNESDIQSAVMCALGEHHLVAWVYVTSTGTYKGLKGGRPIKIGVPGMPDILGQMRDGRLLGIEVKKPGEKPRKEQQDFLDMISVNNGVSGWCDSVEGALQIVEG